ncbi:transcriptional regulator [Bacillus altitudinis]|nr:transcriptional regulator [Bacillus altitudinis]BDC58017.1 transcriptional regulator [Bacillus altitudinis]GJI60679.1 transcriptional regulator [Bacillus altitudinis]
MEILYQGEDMPIKEVQQKLSDEKPINFNTVMTVLNRLTEKGIVEKKTKGRSSIYNPVLTKEEFLNEQTKWITQGLMDDFGPLAVNHMVDAIESADPELLKVLEARLASKKEEKRHD